MIDFPHKHRCDVCELIWEHDPGTGLGMRGEYRPPSPGLSHMCPNCGEAVMRIYPGVEEPNVSHIPPMGMRRFVGANIPQWADAGD